MEFEVAGYAVWYFGTNITSEKTIEKCVNKSTRIHALSPNSYIIYAFTTLNIKLISNTILGSFQFSGVAITKSLNVAHNLW